MNFIKRALQGLAGGFVGGFIIALLGWLLTMTGIGAIIGVPMIAIGALIVVVSPFSAYFRIDAPCPYCGTDVIATSFSKGVTCKACQKRIVIANKHFIKVG